HCFQGLIALVHCCLGDPWAGVGLVLILKTAKHLWRSAELAACMENDIAKLIKSSTQCSTIDKRGPNLLATPMWDVEPNGEIITWSGSKTVSKSELRGQWRG
ncbi:hypothetical protein V8C86DRAFT_2919396, partial [Haematococcus lacustris]